MGSVVLLATFLFFFGSPTMTGLVMINGEPVSSYPNLSTPEDIPTNKTKGDCWRVHGIGLVCYDGQTQVNPSEVYYNQDNLD